MKTQSHIVGKFLMLAIALGAGLTLCARADDQPVNNARRITFATHQCHYALVDTRRGHHPVFLKGHYVVQARPQN